MYKDKLNCDNKNFAKKWNVNSIISTIKKQLRGRAHVIIKMKMSLDVTGDAMFFE
jgi:hypothetical protein